MTFTRQDAYRYIGHPLYDTDHHKIGKIKHAVRGPTGTLNWVTVSTGHLGGEEKFVPIAAARSMDDGLAVPFSKETVKAAPTIPPGRSVSAEQEAALQAHYAGDRPAAEVAEPAVDPNRRRVRPASSEATFGTGTPQPGEPDDVTLQGTGNSAPRHIV